MKGQRLRVAAFILKIETTDVHELKLVFGAGHKRFPVYVQDRALRALGVL